MERFKMTMKKMWAVIWCHRVVYAGLALTHGAYCFGLLEKNVADLVKSGLYAALVLQR